MIPDCQSCGACCFSASERYVRVHGEDYGRLGDDAESLVRWEDNHAYMRMESGRCIALHVEDGRFSCSIYTRRPQTCRDLERGSPSCEGERWQKAPAALRVLNDARNERAALAVLSARPR